MSQKKSRGEKFRSQFGLAIYSAVILSASLTLSLSFTGSVWDSFAHEGKALLADANEIFFDSIHVMVVSLVVYYFVFERIRRWVVRLMNYAAGVLTMWSVYFGGRSILASIDAELGERISGDHSILMGGYTVLLLTFVALCVIFASEKPTKDIEELED